MQDNKDLTNKQTRENINQMLQQINSKEYLEYIESFIQISSEKWLGLKLNIEQ